ncbi:MAG: Fic family protein [Bacteriovoracales bacterium]|nr:Fic family protein [Bacteriovoracales bacterium]
MQSLNAGAFFSILFFWALTGHSAGGLDCLKQKLSSEIGFVDAVFSKVDSKTDFEDLSRLYGQMGEAILLKKSKNIESRNLINEPDWKKASLKLKLNAWSYYGETTFNDWFDGLKFIHSLPKNQKVNGPLLREIHRISSRNLKFHGFEGRRIRERFRTGKISQDEFKRLLDKAFKKNEEVAGIPHSSLIGRYRSDLIDQIEHRGSSFLENGSRYFTKYELDQIRKNKYMRVDEKTIKKVRGDIYQGSAYYLDVGKVGEAVENILQNTEKKLQAAKSLREVLETVIVMEKDLISVHPFLDGNGRSIRLLGDYLLMRKGLPPRLYPNENDLTMSLEEAVNFNLRGMRTYIEQYQREFRAYLKEN